MSLTATNKWCMSGTPICTASTDLVAQLRFIGMGCIPDTQSFTQHSSRPVFDFAAPLVMIRHVQAQKLKDKDGILQSIMVRALSRQHSR